MKATLKVAINSVLTKSITTISSIINRNIQWGKMCQNLILLMSLSIINCVSLLIGELLSSCRLCVRIIVRMAKIWYGNKKGRPNSIILLIFPPKNSEISSKYSAIRSVRCHFSSLISSLKSLKFPSMKIKLPWWTQPSLKISVSSRCNSLSMMNLWRKRNYLRPIFQIFQLSTRFSTKVSR